MPALLTSSTWRCSSFGGGEHSNLPAKALHGTIWPLSQPGTYCYMIVRENLLRGGESLPREKTMQPYSTLSIWTRGALFAPVLCPGAILLNVWFP
jgi:hypothetical protein